MNSSNFEQLLDHFSAKISTIYSLIPLSRLYDNLKDKPDDNQWKRNAVLDSNLLNYNNSDDYRKQLDDRKPDLRDISQMVIEMKTMVDDMRQLIRYERQTIESETFALDNDLKRLHRHCDHINENIPTFLQNLQNSKPQQTDTKTSGPPKRPLGLKNDGPRPNGNSAANARTNASNNQRPTQTSKVGSKSVKKNAIAKNPKNIASIPFITTEEFASIPNYMLGRLTYEVINRAIADINRTIAAKYKIVFNYSLKYSDEEMRKYVAFKEQENSETEGQFFCTMTDLKQLSDLKVETTTRKVLTCLRHCKRIREIRGNPPKLVRYALVVDQFAL